MSQLIDFYRGVSPDSEGRFLGEIWAWSNDDLEEFHDFIQWIFPLLEVSRFNPDAPVLTEEDVATFKADASLRANLEKSFHRILEFLGLELHGDGKVTIGRNFSERIDEVWAVPNHNWLRITRILRSLKVLGLGDKAHVMFDCLEAIRSQRRFPITEETFDYWQNAIESGG
jgi:hypothetical protein